MQRRTIIIAIAVAVIIVLAIVIPLVMTRYYLTPSSEQRVIEQVRTTAAAGTAAAVSTPTPLP
jgi:hypothetical protein